MSNIHRRKLLKSIAAGSGAVIAGRSLPESWSRPVVDSVLLPVHAQTSGAVYSGTGLVTGWDSSDRNSLLAEVTDSLLPQATAQAGGLFYACATVTGSMADVVVAGLSNNAATPVGTKLIRRGTLNLPAPFGSGGEGVITAQGADVSPCTPPQDIDEFNRPARITAVSDASITIEVFTHCAEHGGPCSPFWLSLTVLRSDTGCLPEPAVVQSPCGPPPPPGG